MDDAIFSRRLRACATVAFLVFLAWGIDRAAWAGDPSDAGPPDAAPPSAEAGAEVVPLDGEALARIARLELEVKDLRAAEASAKKRPSLVTAEPGAGITIRNEAGTSTLTIRPRVQLRGTFTQDESVETMEAGVKTARLVLHGNTLGPKLKYFIQLAFGAGDYEKDNSSPIFDAYVESLHERDFNIRVGQFFVPLDRARTIREYGLQFVDRQQVVRELSLDRDIGIMASSSDLFGARGRIAYNLFVGSGEGRNRMIGHDPGALFVARAVYRPFGPFDDDVEGDLSRAKKPRMAVGVASAYNYQTNRASSTFGATSTFGSFNYLHGAVDLVFKYAGFSLLAEGLIRKASTDHYDGLVKTAPTREWSRSGGGYLAQAGMMVERRVELTVRWEQLFVEKSTDPAFLDLQRTRGKQIGGGANLYLNGHSFKLQGDYFYSFGDHPSDGRHAVRLQLDATF